MEVLAERRTPAGLWNSHGAGFREPWTFTFASAHDVQPHFVVTGPVSRLAKGSKVSVTVTDAGGLPKCPWTFTVDDHGSFDAPKWSVPLGGSFKVELIPATGSMKDCRVQLVLGVFKAHGDAAAEVQGDPVPVRSKPPPVAKKTKGAAPPSSRDSGGSRASSPWGSSSSAASASHAAPGPAPPRGTKRRAEEELPPRADAPPPPPGLHALRAGDAGLAAAPSLSDFLGSLPFGITPCGIPALDELGAAAAPSDSRPLDDDRNSLFDFLDNNINTLAPSAPPRR